MEYIKCVACRKSITERLNSISGGIKKISIYYCDDCGTLYLGTPINNSTVNGKIPENSIVRNNFLYIVIQSKITQLFLDKIK